MSKWGRRREKGEGEWGEVKKKAGEEKRRGEEQRAGEEMEKEATQ